MLHGRVSSSNKQLLNVFVTLSWIIWRIFDMKPFTCSLVCSWLWFKLASSSSMPSLTGGGSNKTETELKQIISIKILKVLCFKKFIVYNTSRQSHQFSLTSLGVQSETQNTETKTKQAIINSFCEETAGKWSLFLNLMAHPVGSYLRSQ